MKVFKMAAVVATSDIATNDFISSESQCRSNASNQVLSQSDLPFGSLRLTIREPMWFEDFQDAHRCCHLVYRNRMIFLAILISMSLSCLASSFG